MAERLVEDGGLLSTGGLSGVRNSVVCGSKKRQVGADWI